MNNKEIFTKVKEHLLKQNAQSKDKLSCAYRGDNGLKCAVGCLITDEFYNQGFERFGCNDPSIRIAVEASLGCKLSAGNMKLLTELQTIHDTYEPEFWPRILDLAESKI